MSDQRCSDNDLSKRDIPSFIEPRPPLIMNPFMRPRPQKGTNLLELFEEDSESYEPEWVQVYLRMKPYNARTNLYEVKSDRCLITSVDTATAGHGRRTQHNVSKMYTFSHIFGPESNQKEIFEHVVKENLKKLADGHNFTLLTYGASGSGKTFTLMGTVAAPGLVPRSLEYVFRVVDAAQHPLYKPLDGGAEKLSYAEQDYELQWVKRLRHVSAPLRDKYRRMSAQLRNDLTQSTIDLSNRTRYYVWVSFVEIYNEGIYDLLSNSDRNKATSKLRIREDAAGNVYVKGVTQAFVRTGEEAYDVMAAGKHNLQVAATGVHAQSSRSHCIFTITMLTETESGVRTSCVRLCDLAGSERARRTRNTGARMQESRAINSSLHVLERCLHMLRRKQRQDATLVPYRESKLTRLLGAGLSGSRAEAVSMVVTLNPAPEYAHETKHVLQLAAVAKDIQVNSTIAESTMEMSTTDTTIECSAEVMKLRAENERLHFELVQSQSRNKELIAAMEEKQQEVAKTMSEIVEEAKDMTRQYYEAQLKSLRTEMEEMEEEYESMLKTVQPFDHIDVLRKSDAGTPNKGLQKKVAQLMTEIAILEEKLTAEKLARARAEEEVQHLRACIEERDDKAEGDIEEDVMSVTDSESEDDPCNESLEPTFKKEDINRSRLHHQSLISDKTINIDQDTVEDIHSDNDSIVDKSSDTLKDVDESHNDTANSAYETGDFDSVNVNDTTKIGDHIDEVTNSSKIDDKIEDGKDISKIYAQNDGNEDARDLIKTNLVRGTYFVKDIDTSNITKEKHDILKPQVRGTYFVRDTEISNISNDSKIKDCSLYSEVQVSVTNDAEKDIAVKPYKIVDKMGKDLAVKPDKFVDKMEKDIEVNPDEIVDKLEKDIEVKPDEIVDKLENDMAVKPDTILDKLVKDMAFKPEKIVDKLEKDISAKPEKIVNKLFKLKSQTGSDVSLAQFEQLEKDSLNVKENLNTTEVFSNIKILKEKRKFFDSAEDANLKVKETKTYFDNIDANVCVNKQITEIRNNNLLDDRSPSIVKDDVTNNFEPSTIKKLLGESFTRQPDAISSIHKSKILPKKNASVDIFEGFDSPNIAKMKDNISKPNHKITVEKTIDTKLNKSPDREIVVQSAKKLNVSEKDLKETSPKSTEHNDVTEKLKDTYNEKIIIKTEIINDAKDKRGHYHKTTQKAVEDVAVSIENDTEKPIEQLSKLSEPSIIESTRKSIEKLVLYQKSDTKTISDIKIKTERPSVVEESSDITQTTKENNTIDEFENIYKDVTAPRATEFDLLISQEVSASNISQNDLDKSRYNLRHTGNKKEKTEEVLLEYQAKSQSRPKRNLRLRRRKDQSEDEKSEDNVAKLKDIVNLQTEFSDVTLDVPAARKEVKDIPSPEKTADEENLPPLLGIQSCPSKSVTRSRRKLFTPRPEPLEESMSGTGDSNERVRVPRPSYHRATRVRRKL